MKRTFLTLVAAIITMSAAAQFTKDTNYVATSLSGLSLKYSGGDKTTFGLDATYGRFFWDDVMLLGCFGYNHANKQDNVHIGAGARYYIKQNGLHVGANIQFAHSWADYNNYQIGPEIGYTYFLNHYVTIEPAIYYNISLNDFSHGSEAGLRIGFGYFF